MIFFHIRTCVEEIKLGQIRVDSRIPNPKLITHEQMYPKTLLLKMINISYYYTNPTSWLYLLKDQAITQLFFFFFFLIASFPLMWREYGNWGKYLEMLDTQCALFQQALGFELESIRIRMLCYAMLCYRSVACKYIQLCICILWILWCFCELSFIRMLLEWGV